MIERTLNRHIKRLAQLEDRPERIAFAFAVGIALAFSPFLGLHTFLGLTIAFFFGLNRVALLIGLFVNNPWTLIPIYAAAGYVGGLLFGFPPVSSLPHFEWTQIWYSQFWIEIARHWRLLKPVLLGSVVLSVTSAALSYPMALFLLKYWKSHQAPKDHPVG